jgi:2-oxo-3-hexenedioate decarboxylase
MKGKIMSESAIETLAQEFYEAKAAGKAIAIRPTEREGGLDLVSAYAVEAHLKALKAEEGNLAIGRKIGLANKALLQKFNLDAVLWGHMYTDTVVFASNNYSEWPLAGTVAPKLEPEIVMKLSAPIIDPNADALTILKSIEWIALGYEIVDCPYPGWQFAAPDFVAAFGLHVGLLVGDPLPLENLDLGELAEQLSNCKLSLYKNGEVVENGGGVNVMGNPALAISELALALNKYVKTDLLSSDEIITTGTLTTAPLVAEGQEWVATLEGLDLPGITIKFT